jgi:hypothetical protein
MVVGVTAHHTGTRSYLYPVARNEPLATYIARPRGPVAIRAAATTEVRFRVLTNLPTSHEKLFPLVGSRYSYLAGPTWPSHWDRHARL